MDLPTLYTSLDGEDLESRSCITLLDVDGIDVDVMKTLGVFSFQIGIDVEEKRPGAQVTMVTHKMLDDMVERLGICSKSYEETFDRLPRYRISFRANIKRIAKETV